MCTLVLAWRVFEDAPVAVAANRDEAFDRPSRPPEVIDDDPAVLAPRDEEAGGTWLGYNERGVFVAITNRWVEREGERSRGLLVRDALACESAEAAARHVERELDEREYQPFHLVVADGDAAFLIAWDGARRVENFDPGIHVVVNVGWDGDFFVPEVRPELGRQQADNARRVGAELRPEPGEGADAWLDRAKAVLADHEYGVCIHGDGFGTKSSSAVKLGTERRFEYADGPPCETPFRTVEGEV